MTVEEWQAEGERRFGADTKKWKFVCPSCGHVASVQDWMDVKAPNGAIAFSCVGRWMKEHGHIWEGKQPCNYAGGGLFRLNPVKIEGMEDMPVFAFAEEEKADERRTD